MDAGAGAGAARTEPASRAVEVRRYFMMEMGMAIG